LISKKRDTYHHPGGSAALRALTTTRGGKILELTKRVLHLPWGSRKEKSAWGFKRQGSNDTEGKISKLPRKKFVKVSKRVWVAAPFQIRFRILSSVE